MTFKSEDEALDALQEARSRLISDGYEVAVDLAREHGAVHAQMVLAEMSRRGLIGETDDEHSRHWVAVVFKGRQFKGTWEKVGHVKVGDKERNVHAAPRMLWKLSGERGPDGGHSDEVCPVCGRGEKDRPSLMVLRRGLDTLRRIHLVARLDQSDAIRISEKEHEALGAVGKWLRKVVTRGQ